VAMSFLLSGENKYSYIVMSILELMLLCEYAVGTIRSFPSHSDVDASIAFVWFAVPLLAPLLIGTILKLYRVFQLRRSAAEHAAQEQTIS
jgi:hypothetical protein